MGHVATLVWQYEDNPTVFGGFMGNVQRHASGGTMISWGGTPVSPQVTELHADGTKAYELALAPRSFTYRAFRFPWRTNRMVTNTQSLDFGRVVGGGSLTLPLSVRNNSASPLTITDLVTTDSMFSSPTAVPFTIPAGQSAPLSVAFSPPSSGHFTGNLYLRSVGPTQLIAQVVALSGSADVTSATADPGQARTILHTPFAPEGGPVEIRFGIGESGVPVRLAIFDARGLRVRLLDRSVRDPGEYVLRWDRRDDRGRRVSRGVYFVQLRASGYSATKKIAVLH
jgi:hypothetical protein